MKKVEPEKYYGLSDPKAADFFNFVNLYACVLLSNLLLLLLLLLLSRPVERLRDRKKKGGSFAWKGLSVCACAFTYTPCQVLCDLF